VDTGLGKQTLDGLVSLVVSVAATVATADGDGSYDRPDLPLAVAVSAFLSGVFTSYFAGE